ncbi:MAG TPA: cation diffusion facilitator family transporter [Myxococcota bacterium]|nr:cation diffusion facilitator family transporter [Myxococcota bacterium]
MSQLQTELGSGAAKRSAALRAGIVSLVASVLILFAKLAAYLYTGSMALLADAAESSVNVIAASVMTFSVAVSRRPPDADHPYGHGKAEPLSAAVEGALIAGAALFIAVEAARRLVAVQPLGNLDLGMAISAAAGVANLALGLYLLAVARREKSEAVRADGVHVLSDTFTTAASIGALVAVRVTGLVWIDPVVALVVAVNLAWAGARVVRGSLTGLLDEADFKQLERLAKVLEAARRPEWCDIHQLRSRGAGRIRHVDLHLVVPRYFSMDEAHRVEDGLESVLARSIEENEDLVVHIDPCRPLHCAGCTMPDCPVRSTPLGQRAIFDAEHLTQPGPI